MRRFMKDAAGCREVMASKSRSTAPLFLNQCGLTGGAQPAAVLPGPGVGEAASPGIGLSTDRSLFVIDATHDDDALVNFSVHGFVDDSSELFWRTFYAIQEFGLVFQAAINIDEDELFSE